MNNPEQDEDIYQQINEALERLKQSQARLRETILNNTDHMIKQLDTLFDESKDTRDN